MRAAVCTEHGRIELQEVEKPVPGTGEVIVRVKSVGVCGSDVDGLYGKHPMIKPPIILGHECSGVIAETGSGVDPGRIGEAVSVEPFFICETCRHCRAGDYNLCSDLKIIGHQVAGGFAEYLKIPARFAHCKPETLSFDEAAILEPCSGALHAVRRCGIQSGDIVVIIGGGTMGTFALQHCRNLGADVIVIEPVGFKRDLAVTLGAIRVVDPSSEDPQTVISELTAGVMADIVIEAVGIEETMRIAVPLVANGGTVMLIGWTGNAFDAFDLTNLTLRELTVLGTLGFANDFPRALRLAGAGKVDIDCLITHHYGLDEVQTAIEELHSRRDGMLKSVVNIA